MLFADARSLEQGRKECGQADGRRGVSRNTAPTKPAGTCDSRAVPSFRFTLEYDGSDFAGWQRQSQGERTVQATFEAALGELAGAPVQVRGSGRTDTGVHALGQVASATFETSLDAETLRRALNAKLPGDIAVREAANAPSDFDARRSATGKLYRYSIWNGRERSPLRARRFAFIPVPPGRSPLDSAAMSQAARALVGEHDFAAFQAAGTDVRTTTRLLSQLDLNMRGKSPEGREIHLEVYASGFLRHMVRNLAGTLIEVGQGRRDVASMPALLASKDRSQAGPTAPAQGLTLIRVDYPARALECGSG